MYCLSNGHLAISVLCTGGVGSLLQAVQAEWTTFNALICEQDTTGGMCNEFGEIQRKG